MRRFRRDERGNAMIEFALSFFLMWALFTGVFQFGYAFWVYNSLQTAVGDAAQLGAKLDYDTGSTAGYTSQLTNMVLYGNTSSGSTPVVPGLTAANVSVDVNASSSMPTNITVSIVNYQIDAFFMKLTINGKPSTTAPYLGHIVCASC